MSVALTKAKLRKIFSETALAIFKSSILKISLEPVLSSGMKPMAAPALLASLLLFSAWRDPTSHSAMVAAG